MHGASHEGGTAVAASGAVTVVAEPLEVSMIIQRYHPHLGGAEIASSGSPNSSCEHRAASVTRRLPRNSLTRSLVDSFVRYSVSRSGGKLTAASTYLLGSLLRLGAASTAAGGCDARMGCLRPATIGLAAKWLNHRPLVVKVLQGGALSRSQALARRPAGAAAQAAVSAAGGSLHQPEHRDRCGAAGGWRTRARSVRIPSRVDVERFSPPTAEAFGSAAPTGSRGSRPRSSRVGLHPRRAWTSRRGTSASPYPAPPSDMDRARRDRVIPTASGFQPMRSP